MRVASPFSLGRLVAALAVTFALLSASASATLEDYFFQVSSDSRMAFTNPSTAYGACDDCSAGGFSIGFTFRYNGADYTTFSVNTNGLMGLGSTTVTNLYINSDPFNYIGTMPVLMPFWCDQMTTGNCIRYQTLGSTGSRILVVDWEVVQYGNTGNSFNYQVRLYEGTNRIEFWYGSATSASSFSATIGLWSSSNDYSTVNVKTGELQFKTQNFSSPAPSSGTVYAFYTACVVSVLGNVPQGGTAGMFAGDTLLTNVTLERGNSTTRQPFTTVFNACLGGPMTYFVTGPAAADYTFTPSSTTTSPSTPVVTFNPRGSGDRFAILTLFGGNQFSQVYYLRARATPRLQFIPDLAQGGASPMVDGAHLLSNVRIARGATAVRIPFSIRHIGTTGPVSITYSLAGNSGGQYDISASSASLNPGESTSLTVTFMPSGIGVISDTLVVNADGDILKFPLAAFSEGTGGFFSIDGAALDTNSLLFVNQYGCVGEQFVTLPMLVTNIGSLPFRIEGVDGYVTDTTYRQGTPRYPLKRDQFGNFIPAGDYIVTTTPPTSGGAFATYPIVIPVGQSQILYLTFTPTRPGKRFARVFIRTNDEVHSAPDTMGIPRQGLVVFDAFGRGSGSQLSDNPDGGLPKSLVFDKTPLGMSQDKWLMIQNTGDCPLRLDEGALRINSGDFDEFSVLGASSSWPRDASNDLLLPPGGLDSIQVRFTPRHVGSRRATLYMGTNDSTIITRGLTERGVYYMDLYGEGKDGLYAGNAVFPQTEITTSSAAQTVTLRNAADIPFIIQSTTIVGTDAGDFAEDGAQPWPARPFAIMPGQSVDLSLVFTPGGSTPGPRIAELELVTDRDDTLRAALSGDAGTKTVSGPTTLSFGTLSVGGETRQTFAITNTGTMPSGLTPPVVTGTNAAEYTVSPLTRTALGVGETEMVEVAWRPAAVGASSATLTIGAEGGDVVMSLSGNAVKTRYVGEDPTGTIGSNGGGNVVPPGTQGPTNGTSSVDGASRLNGISLWQTIPNPTRDRAEIHFGLERATLVKIELFDEAGRLVRAIDNGLRPAGEHRLIVDLSGIPAGAYRCVLTSNETRLTQPITVVR